MQAVLLKYIIPSLAKLRINYTYARGEKYSPHEKIYPKFNTIILGMPVCYSVEVDPRLMNQLGKYFGLVYAQELHLNRRDIRARVDTDTDAPDVPVRRVHCGKLLDIYYIEFITDVANDIYVPYLLARVKECQTGGLDTALPRNPLVVYY
ncbi:unnamed protein product [Rhizoctonia solani]|uniref:Uncharacterized protein n=1 Tax=Rhizoctonia solani TaxID=456999 RepID=A0A8H3E3K4_9AGAM|nr:unnamed protein product [Rhizoctonia solani]